MSVKLTLSSVNDIVRNITAKIEKVSEAEFKKMVTRFYLSTTKIRETVLAIVKSRLKSGSRTRIDGVFMPDMRGTSSPRNKGSYHLTGNMLDKIIYDKYKLPKEPKFIKTSKGLRTTLTFKYGVDWNGRGYTVKTKKKKIPYAEALDSNSKYSKYNGFKEVVSDVYRETLIDSVQDNINAIFRY